MNNQDSSEDTSSLSRLSGFAPIDERREARPRQGAGRWAFWALAGLPLVALAFLFTGIAGGGPLLGALAIIGLKMLAKRADGSDQIARELDDQRRKDEEDLLLAQRLAETRNRMKDDLQSR